MASASLCPKVIIQSGCHCTRHILPLAFLSISFLSSFSSPLSDPPPLFFAANFRRIANSFLIKLSRAFFSRRSASAADERSSSLSPIKFRKIFIFCQTYKLFIGPCLLNIHKAYTSNCEVTANLMDWI
jgi:hypothetical protein